MKKLFAILLSLVMLFSLAACTSGGDKKDPIVGTWEGSMDLGAMLGAVMQVDIDEKISCKMTFTFKEDGTYSMQMDKDNVEAAMEKVADFVIDMLVDVYKQQGVDLEAELAKEGMTMEDFIETVMGEVSLEDAIGETEASGYYKYENGKLYTVDEKEELEGDLEDMECTHITLEGNTMQFTDMEQDGEKLSELMPGMFPMVFTKK